LITQDETGRWSNRAQDTITLEPYDPRWADQFSNERRTIRGCVDFSVPLVIEHVGSTAVPGLPSKPIIDILIGASSRDWPSIVEALKGIGYVHWEDNPEPDREFLVKGMPPFGIRRTHHVHICEVGGRLWDKLLFRDYLRQHAEDRIAYADLKRRLAADYPGNREAYTNGKGGFVADIMNRARGWRRS
jgi:GrpB-like predicted nucleotidyltransferase (UPF0157 family)